MGIACSGPVDAIVSMLADDARYSMPPLRQVFVGAEAIREFLQAGPLRRPDQTWRFLPTHANGQIAFGTYLWDTKSGTHAPAGLDLLAFTPTGQIAEVVSFLAGSPRIWTPPRTGAYASASDW